MSELEPEMFDSFSADQAATLTNKEILEKAKKKAYENGYLAPNGIGISEPDFFELLKLKMFAKALWGESMIVLEYTPNGMPIHAPEWKKHLMLMVIADDPIKYLGENI